MEMGIGLANIPAVGEKMYMAIITLTQPMAPPFHGERYKGTGGRAEKKVGRPRPGRKRREVGENYVGGEQVEATYLMGSKGNNGSDA